MIETIIEGYFTKNQCEKIIKKCKVNHFLILKFHIATMPVTVP